MIEWTCIACGAKVDVPDDEAGQMVRCPRCRCSNTAPSASTTGDSADGDVAVKESVEELSGALERLFDGLKTFLVGIMWIGVVVFVISLAIALVFFFDGKEQQALQAMPFVFVGISMALGPLITVVLLQIEYHLRQLRKAD